MIKNNLLQELPIDNRFTIFVYKGSLSPFDIRVKYQDMKCERIRERTPKHIHWVADILLKKTYKSKLTNQLINEMIQVWDKTPHITNKTQQKNSLSIRQLWDIKQKIWKRYKPLDHCGEYSSKFIIVLLQLLMSQEKANKKDAYFFSELLGLLNKKDINLWKIISIATHNGR